MTNNYVGKGEDGPRGQNGGLGLSGGPALPKPPTGLPGVLVGTCSWTGHTAPSGGGRGLPGAPGVAPGLIGGAGGPGSPGTAGSAMTIDANTITGTILLDFRGGR